MLIAAYHVLVTASVTLILTSANRDSVNPVVLLLQITSVVNHSQDVEFVNVNWVSNIKALQYSRLRLYTLIVIH